MSFAALAGIDRNTEYIPKVHEAGKVGMKREYEATVRTVIAEEKGNTVVTLRGPELSGSLALPQPAETLKPGTVVRVTVESPQ